MGHTEYKRGRHPHTEAKIPESWDNLFNKQIIDWLNFIMKKYLFMYIS